jgi:Cu/Ag efflux protein CusF
MSTKSSDTGLAEAQVKNVDAETGTVTLKHGALETSGSRR